MVVTVCGIFVEVGVWRYIRFLVFVFSAFYVGVDSFRLRDTPATLYIVRFDGMCVK